MAKILIIEDDPASRYVLARAFAAAGHLTSEAADGVAGLRLIEALVPEVVVTDLCMPEFDGIELIDLLRHRQPGMLVLAVSGQTSEHYRRIAGLLGAQRMFTKPVDPAAVVEAVNELLAMEAR